MGESNAQCNQVGIVGDNFGTQNNTFVHGLKIADNVRGTLREVIGRDDLVDQIARAFDTGSAAALSGLVATGEGGQGKSVLSILYAEKYRDRYPLGRVVAPCSGLRPVEVFSERAPFELTTESSEVRARATQFILAEQPGYLLILDNVDDSAHWQEFVASGLLPGTNCHVLVTCREGVSLPSVSVDRLTPDQCRDLLAKYAPSAKFPENQSAVEMIVKETEGLAVLVAAVGAAMATRSTPDWPKYAAGISMSAVGMLPCASRTHSTVAILDDLYSRLAPDETQMLKYAVYLPQDRIRDEWLVWLLSHDITFGEVSPSEGDFGQTRTPPETIKLLRAKGLFTGEDVLSIHRLHARRIRERLKEDLTGGSLLLLKISFLASDLKIQASNHEQRAEYHDALSARSAVVEIFQRFHDATGKAGSAPLEIRVELARAYSDRGNAHQLAQDLDAAIADYSDAIELWEGMRSELKAKGQWTVEGINGIAIPYMNRGNARVGQREFDAAIADYTMAINLREGSRQELESQDQWQPAFCNDLAGVYLVRGNAHMGKRDLAAAIVDYTISTDLREGLREKLEPHDRWSPSFRMDLACVYMSRGIAHHEKQDWSNAIVDHNDAVRLMEAVRETVDESEWTVAYRGQLAGAYLNRGNAHLENRDTAFAIEDYGSAIKLRNGVVQKLRAQGQLPPALCNDLAIAYLNRGIANQRHGTLQFSIADFSVAIKLMEEVRDVLEPKGQWWPAFRKSLRLAYANRSVARMSFHDVNAATEDLRRAEQIEEG